MAVYQSAEHFHCSPVQNLSQIQGTFFSLDNMRCLCYLLLIHYTHPLIAGVLLFRKSLGKGTRVAGKNNSKEFWYGKSFNETVT